MAAFGKQVIVLGGESNAAFAQTRPDDPSVVHVLDTGACASRLLLARCWLTKQSVVEFPAKIKYPADVPRPAGQQQIARKSSMPAMVDPPGQSAQPQQLPSGMDDTSRPRTASLGRQSAPPAQVQTQTRPVQNIPSSSPEVVASRAMSPMTTERQPNGNPPRSASSASLDRSPQQAALGPPLNLDSIAERQLVQSNDNQANATKSNGPPQRPRRQDDDVYGVGGDRSRPFSPIDSTETNSAATHKQTPVNGDEEHSSSTQASLPRTMSPQHAYNGAVGRARAAQSPSADQPPPADAFYYGARSPIGTGFSADRPNSVISSGDVMRELKDKDAEIAAAKHREAVLRAALQQAKESGFLSGGSEDGLGLDSSVDRAHAEQTSSTLGMNQALLQLKQNYAALRVSGWPTRPSSIATYILLPNVVCRTNWQKPRVKRTNDKLTRNAFERVPSRRRPFIALSWPRWMQEARSISPELTRSGSMTWKSNLSTYLSSMNSSAKRYHSSNQAYNQRKRCEQMQRNVKRILPNAPLKQQQV